MLRCKNGRRATMGRMISETKDVTTLVNAWAILDAVSQLRFERLRRSYIKPNATSRTLSRTAKLTKPSQARLTVLWALWPARRSASVLSSRRGMSLLDVSRSDAEEEQCGVVDWGGSIIYMGVKRVFHHPVICRSQSIKKKKKKNLEAMMRNQSFY